MMDRICYIEERVLFKGGTSCMLLRCDEQLLTAYRHSGEVGAEALLSKWAEDSANPQNNPQIFGQTLSLDLFLVSEEVAMNVAFSTARKYWGRVPVEARVFFENQGLDSIFMNERLNSFFYSQKGKETFFEQLYAQHTMNVEQLIWLIFGKRRDVNIQTTELQTIFLYKIENEYIVHMIYKEDMQFWHWLFMKKVYSLLIHKPLEQLTFIHELMRHFEYSAQKSYTHVHNFSYNYKKNLDKCITYVDNKNPSCLAKKQLQLYQIVAHYMWTENDFRKVRELIASFEVEWRYSMYALTEKEKVLISYILLNVAHKEKHVEEVIQYGEYLLDDERLNNYAIEIMLEYKELLPNIKPTPQAIVKNYANNYLENLYAMLLQNYVQTGNYSKGLKLLKEQALVSSKKIHEALVYKKYSHEQFIAIESAIQKDIAIQVNNSLQQIGASVEEWRQHYRDPEAPYYYTAQSSSLNMMNILKVLFVMEQYELFEKLMEMYKKYLLVDEHFEEMRLFISAYV